MGFAAATGTWSFSGVLFINATRFQTNVDGVPRQLRPPGEPYEDLNQNAQFDDGAEGWIDLDYPAMPGEPFIVVGPGPERNARGGPIPTTASIHGVLFTSGRFEASGTATHYGSVIARQGVVQEVGTAGTPEIYWDASLVELWPPDNWTLPRVVITSWVTDL